MSKADHLALAAAASRAPSVHNIQPARFRFDEDGAVTLLEDRARRIPIADPEGKDNWKSLGAAWEGLVLALSERGQNLAAPNLIGDADDTLRAIARGAIASGGDPDSLASYADSRASWRGAFAPLPDDAAALDRLGARCDDLVLVQNRDQIADIAHFYDEISLEILRDDAYRAELVSWMRLSPRDPNYARDGLSAAHMAMSGFEAAGAGIVLKPNVFPVLDKIGLAGPLIAEGPKVRSAAAVALFHRPADEHEFETGRRFYRVWLEMEREGLRLCPMSVLADSPRAAARLMTEYAIGADRKLVNAFRVGRRPAKAIQPPRARLPASMLLV